MFHTIKERILEHVAEHAVKYFFLLLCFGAGIAAGAFFVRALSPEKSDELMGIISQFCSGISDGETHGALTLRLSALGHLRSVVILYLCGMSLYLVPLVFLSIAARGFVIGFTVGFMSLFFGGKGFLFVLAGVLPQTLIVLPVVMAMSVMSIRFAMSRKKGGKNTALLRGGGPPADALRFGYMTVGVLLILMLSSMMDAFVIPVFVKGISRLFL